MVYEAEIAEIDEASCRVVLRGEDRDWLVARVALQAEVEVHGSADFAAGVAELGRRLAVCAG